MLSMGDLHIQEPGASPAKGLVDVVLSSPASVELTVGLLDVTLQ